MTDQLRGVLARAGFTPGRDRGQVLVDGMCALAAGATCASDVEALTRAQEIFGPGGGASDTTFGRVLGEFGSCLDGAGASHEVIDHLTALNTARRPDATYDRRGRRVEYSVGRPGDARTRSGIERLREQDRSPALHPDGTPDPGAQVAELTAILRTGIGGDELQGRPGDLRVIARRTPRDPGEQAELGDDAHWHTHRRAETTRDRR